MSKNHNLNLLGIYTSILIHSMITIFAIGVSVLNQFQLYNQILLLIHFNHNLTSYLHTYYIIVNSNLIIF